MIGWERCGVVCIRGRDEGSVVDGWRCGEVGGKSYVNKKVIGFFGRLVWFGEVTVV